MAPPLRRVQLRRLWLAGCLALAACLSTSGDRSQDPCKNAADGTDCDAGLCCGQVCTSNFATDPNNCGVCGLVCPYGQLCQDGGCQGCGELPTGTSCQDNFGNGVCCSGTCSNPLADSMNCGACGQACSLQQKCVDAGCIPICANQPDNSDCSLLEPGDGTCCSQVCVNPNNDPGNCYSCGTVCPSGTCINASCAP